MDEAADRGAPGGLAGQVIALGREGLGRAEIAAALEVGIAEPREMAAADGKLAAALGRAADLERAGWEALAPGSLAEAEAAVREAAANQGAAICGNLWWKRPASAGAGELGSRTRRAPIRSLATPLPFQGRIAE